MYRHCGSCRRRPYWVRENDNITEILTILQYYSNLNEMVKP